MLCYVVARIRSDPDAQCQIWIVSTALLKTQIENLIPTLKVDMFNLKTILFQFENGSIYFITMTVAKNIS